MEQTAYPPNHYIRWVAELKVETLNEVEQLETNIVGKTAFAYIGKTLPKALRTQALTALTNNFG